MIWLHILIAIGLIFISNLLLNKITRITGVTGVHTSFVLRKVIERTSLPLP